nr:hypothetical protein [Lachnospiraceae bacterium]
MFRVLLKKQLAEVFRNYFYNQKKNTMRSIPAIVGYFLLFLFIMVGLLGGIFSSMAMSFCGVLTQLGFGWLYFFIMGGCSVAIGAFGSVFNTYSSLYLAKDNDLLLSLPIPTGTIMAARLVNVYLLGTMYSMVVLIPSIVVYWIETGVTLTKVICGVLLALTVTVIVLILSCLLGWVVAKLSQRVKNKSFITVLASLIFLSGYYYISFKSSDLIMTTISNASLYAEKIKGYAYVIYLFGRIGEGDLIDAVGFLIITLGLLALVWFLMKKSFLQIATADTNTGKARYKERAIRQKTIFGALLTKEFDRFTSSANYMLNSGLGIIMIPAGGVVLLINGRRICNAVEVMLEGRSDSGAVLICALLCMVSSINDMVVPSVSLEGKSLWIPQSLPIRPKQVIRAKLLFHLILTEIPMLIAVICATVIVPSTNLVKVLICVVPLIYLAFSSVYGMTLGIRMPLLNWTTETVPIKQSGAVSIFIFTGWGFSILMAGLYLIIGYRFGAAAYLSGCCILFALAGILLLRWLDTKGAEAF